ncbi:hypothetical protein ACO1LN_13870, partial [Staphylococcus aureus]
PDIAGAKSWRAREGDCTRRKLNVLDQLSASATDATCLQQVSEVSKHIQAHGCATLSMVAVQHVGAEHGEVEPVAGSDGHRSASRAFTEVQEK